jgi:hypothetical protein
MKRHKNAEDAMTIQCKEYKWTKPFTGGNDEL